MGFAQLRGLFEHGVEHRLQLARRRIDDLQHLGCRCLLLQRLARFGDQSRILNRDDGLISKGGYKFNLPLSERFDPRR